MNVLITPVGSAGDNYPFIGLGAGMARCGHRVTVITGDSFGPLVRSCGMEFVSVGSEEEYREAIADPMIWHPTKGLAFIMKLLGRQVARLYDAVSDRVDDDTIVVAHSLDFASRTIAEKRGLPVVTAHLSPSIVRTNYETGVLTGTTDYSRLPRWVKGLIWRGVDRFMVDPAAGPVVNDVRARAGLGPVRRVFERALHSPLLTVGMWPAWFAARQPDHPEFLKLTGFPMWDGGAGAQPVAADVAAYLDAGDPPVVYTPGSANIHGQAFFAAAVDAAKRLGRRTMLLSKFAEHVPADLPANVRHFAFAPLSRILPRCAALVHHGGIGTTAAGLAGGVPQIIMPMSHDQPKNAHWVRKLGVGERVMPKKFTGGNVANTLAVLLNSAEVKARCADVAGKCAAQDGLAETADLIESVGPPRHPTRPGAVAALRSA